jgi:hypothetical protein
MALIGSYFLVVVPTFPCPLSSQEIDVVIALRKDDADGRELFYGNAVESGLYESVPRCIIAFIM